MPPEPNCPFTQCRMAAAFEVEMQIETPWDSWKMPFQVIA
jgi:hypothetical protein